ncbi:MAG: EAL domain-containing protein [Candidatus Eremiobacteraeota bacterium]|nr:EAL domain-containing protein [Candidatus Eremiobacteraeota bacterium]
MSQTLNVLCVDDSPDDADLNVIALRRHGMEISYRRVDTREDAIDAFKEKWDLVLCDYSMPQFSANGLLNLLIEHQIEAPCIIVSGAIGDEAAAEAIRLGASDYVLKDNLKRLGPSVDRALREAYTTRARQKAERALFESEARLKIIVDQLPALIWTTDSNLMITSFEGAELGALHIDPWLLVGQKVGTTLFLDEASRLITLHSHQQALEGDSFRFEIEWAGKTRQAHVEPLRDVEGKIIGTIAVALDISERKMAEQRLHHLSQFDALTDLPNRVLLEDRVAQALGTARRYGGEVALVFLDVDRFKYINDTYGHHNGDEVLKGVAARLAGLMPSNCTLSRSGGDEFILLLVDSKDRASVEALAAEVLESFRVPFSISGREVYLTSSLGISRYPSDAEDVPSLLKSAETAMYEAKQLGRNAFQFFVPNMLAAPAERLTLQTDLQRSIIKEQLVMYYQPIFDIDGETVVAYEALVRWNHHALGVLLPDTFIPLAEESGFIEPLGEWALNEICRQANEWSALGFNAPRVCFNVSARQFERRGLRKTIERILDHHHMSPDRLELELTESSIMKDVSSAIATLCDLKDIGLRLSIDDFGTGYTSLSFLKRFPLDVLKIDKSFVRDMRAGSHDEAIVKAVTTLARNLGLTSIAEGVETASQLEQLRAIRCDEVQGFLMSRPLSAEQCLAFRRPAKVALG